MRVVSLLALGGWNFGLIDPTEVLQFFLGLATGLLNVWALLRAIEDAKWVQLHARNQLMQVLVMRRIRQTSLFIAIQLIFLIVAIVAIFLPAEASIQRSVSVALQNDYRGMAIMAAQILLAFQSVLDFWDVKTLEMFPWKGTDRRSGERRGA